MGNTDNTPSAKAPGNSAGMAELIALGRSIGTPITVAGQAPVIIVPEGFHAEELPPEKLKPLPDHIRQTTTLVDAESFSAYVNRYKTEETLIFASLPDAQGKNAGFLALFDYHLAAAKPETGKRKPDSGDAQGGPGAGPVAGPIIERPAVVPSQANRCAHRAVYPCPFSKPWLTWLEISGKSKSQVDFIEFIDQNARDIASPAAADVLTFLENFESKTGVEFQSKIDRTRGALQLNYKESPEYGNGSGSVQVPEAIVLKLPVFEGGKLWAVEGKFRWKAANGKLTVSVQLYRTDDVLREALDALRAEIAAATGIAPLSGAPQGDGK